MSRDKNISKEIISMMAAFEGDIVRIYQSHYSPETFNKKVFAVRKELADSIEKQIEKAKQEAREGCEADIAQAIGYRRGLGYPNSYLEKRYPHLGEYKDYQNDRVTSENNQAIIVKAYKRRINMTSEYERIKAQKDAIEKKQLKEIRLEAVEEFGEKIKRRFQFNEKATAKISVRGIEEDVKNVIDELLAEMGKKKR